MKLDMRKRGLEPLRGYPHYHLKVARIPFRHLRIDSGKQYMPNDRFASRSIFPFSFQYFWL
jgi:hypothetical protein